MEEDKKNPLAEILIDAEADLDKVDQLLAQIIKPYAGINKANGKISFNETAEQLTAVKKVLLFFALQFAKKRLGLIKDAGATQAQVIELLAPEGLPEGTIKTSMNVLRTKRFIGSVTSDSRYEIALSKLKIIVEEFKNYGNQSN